MKKTLILGASNNPGRYSNRAMKMLHQHGIETVGIGRRKDHSETFPILDSIDLEEKFHTVSIYLSPENQKNYYADILKLKPERIIFNPGSENQAFEQLLTANHIPFEQACTLVLLSTGQY
ncbi:MAG: CoA-binding protein [Flavobacteriaceae bacterium]|nr:CoA-binding protein [Flavobacteriaceae bacterium]MDZ4147551.1 CoA-binding protein [Flavobacteriaceae bacterium]